MPNVEHAPPIMLRTVAASPLSQATARTGSCGLWRSSSACVSAFWGLFLSFFSAHSGPTEDAYVYTPKPYLPLSGMQPAVLEGVDLAITVVNPNI
ncbi:hypothetical protein EW145_g6510 [Phellinidium pouzarii]|uniref:Uncharacterized protein n=1 Tax=Phellinidium pouzarii TaxID=167371 RepID=A0A4S4KWF2_9AGAM|nr:hypothetical protein EW145_g6510 [Phellinidium pouzarii]